MQIGRPLVGPTGEADSLPHVSAEYCQVEEDWIFLMASFNNYTVKF